MALMRKIASSNPSHRVRNLAAQMLVAASATVGLATGFLGTSPAWAANTSASGSSAGELRSRFTELRDQLAQNEFGRPLVLESQEDGKNVRGDVYAVIAAPYAKVDQSLRNPANWCEVMILHPNTKQCEADQRALHVSVGRKIEQPVEDAYALNLNYSVASSTADYFQVQLLAKEGPLGTSNYRIIVEAVAIPGGRTFLHLSYSYGSSFAGQMATKAYLATAGRSKVGFSTVGGETNGKPQYIGGVRGAVERNAMRYYLAIEAYLQSLNAPPSNQFDKRLNTFFAGLEQYPLQLREMDRSTYFVMKRREYDRQQKTQGL